MIYWGYVNRPSGEPAVVTVTEEEREPNWEEIKEGVIGVASAIGFTISLLWWLYLYLQGLPTPMPTFAAAACNDTEV